MPSGPGPISDDPIADIADIAAAVPPPISTFLLTSETTAESIAAHVRRTAATTVQTVSHIPPPPTEVPRLATLTPSTRRVQVIHVEGREALDLIPAYAPHVHAFLLDSGRPGASVPELGGTGRAHNWKISAEFVGTSPRPVFLAGGLTAENVAGAIRRVRPFGVDLCSGVRTDGHLDEEKLAALVTAVRKADLPAIG